MQEKLTIIDGKCIVLDFVRSVFLDIWRIERYMFVSGLYG